MVSNKLYLVHFEVLTNPDRYCLKQTMRRLKFDILVFIFAEETIDKSTSKQKPNQNAGKEGSPQSGTAEAISSPVKELKKLFGQIGGPGGGGGMAAALPKGLREAPGGPSKQPGKASVVDTRPTAGAGEALQQAEGSRDPSHPGTLTSCNVKHCRFPPSSRSHTSTFCTRGSLQILCACW